MGIYAHELYHKYDVEVILRVGTCGAYNKDINILDVLLVTSRTAIQQLCKDTVHIFQEKL